MATRIITHTPFKLFWIFGTFLIFIVIPIWASLQSQQITEGIQMLHDLTGSDELQSPTVTVTYDQDQWVATLTCTFTYVDTAEISWHVQGLRIDDSTSNAGVSVVNTFSDGQVNSVLTINNFNYGNVNQYTCMLAQPSGFTNSTMWVAPKPVINDGDNTTYSNLTEHDKIELKCSTFIDAPIFWRLPGLADNYTGLTFSSNSSANNVSIYANFQLNGVDTSQYYQCCMSMKKFGQHSQCTTFPVLVKSAPILWPLVACSGDSHKCSVAALMFSFPYLNKTMISWTSDSGTPISGTFHNTKSKLLAISYFATDFTQDNYTCTAYNSFSTTQLNISIPYDYVPLPPIVTGKRYKYNETEDTATFRCIIYASPSPSDDDCVFWMRISLDGQSNGTEIIQNGTNAQFFIHNAQDDIITTKLNVFNFTEANEFLYFCGAKNTYGINIAYMVFNESTYTVEIDVNYFYIIGDNVTATCTANGYPLPKISWNILSEFDTEYNITADYTNYDKTISTLEFEAHENSSFIHIECSAYNVYEPSKKLSTSKDIRIIYEPVILSVSSCTDASFGGNQSCTMSCDFQSVDASTLKDWDWRYYTTTADQYASLNWGAMKVLTPYRNQLTLNLSSYSSGIYRCFGHFEYTYGGISAEIFNYQDFNIYSDAGKQLGQSCTKSEECLALYSTCYEGTCQCVEPNYIPYDQTSTTLECLAPALPNQPCINDQQCQAGENNYICKTKASTGKLECTCNGTLCNVVEVYQQLCLQSAKYGQKCTYSEECMLNDLNTICSDNECRCAQNYGYDSYYKKCVPITTGSLSVSAIVVIVFACLLLTAVLISLITGYMKNRRHSPYSNAPSSSVTLSELTENDGDVPYSQFSNPFYTEERAVDVGDQYDYQRQELEVTDGHHNSTETDS